MQSKLNVYFSYSAFTYVHSVLIYIAELKSEYTSVNETYGKFTSFVYSTVSSVRTIEVFVS